MLSGGKVVVFDRFVTIFGQKYGSFNPKIFGRIFFGKNPLLAILRLIKRKERKKVPMANKLEGGG